MRILAIETATEACSLALFADGVLVAAHHEVIGRGHAERLVPLIAALPDKGRAGEIRVSLGPGSFTGTRIGIAAARALGIAWGAQVRGYPTLALTCAAAQQVHGPVPLTVAMTGGHGEIFLQAFDARGLPTNEAASLAPAAAATAAETPLVAGTMAAAVVAARGWGEAALLGPDARHALALPAALIGCELAPLYGRPPDARLPAA